MFVQLILSIGLEYVPKLYTISIVTSNVDKILLKVSKLLCQLEPVEMFQVVLKNNN